MRQRLLKTLLFLLCLCWLSCGWAQNNNPYHINGNARQENCNCYTLTNDEFNQSGSVWNINKINLTQSFDYKFNVYLGCRDGDGADGLVFVLQPISTSIGSVGGGLGYQGITPSIGVAIDTWQNINDNDPPADHLSIHRNGDLVHGSANNLAGPITTAGGNIEDCQWHVLQITWDALTKKFTAVIDQRDTATTTIDLVTAVFNGNPEVFWGFTGSTGGSRNWQRFCTSLNPGIAALPTGTVTCFPTPIQFSDSSVSFGNIVKWHWDFGDGTTDSVKTPAPHVYPAPGIYDVTVAILGNNGCLSDTFKRQVIVGSQPVLKFGYDSDTICENTLVTFTDSSTVQFGSISQWNWTLSGNSNSIPSQPTYKHLFGTQGSYQMELSVQTREGCTAGPATKSFSVFPVPEVDMTVMDACIDDAVNFISANLNPSVPISNWYWSLGDGSNSSNSNVQHIYDRGGIYNVKLAASTSDGCTSDTVTKPVTIYATNAFAGRDTVVATGQPFQLRATGGIFYSWSPATGLSDPGIANPIATVQSNTQYVLTAYTPLGCATTDTINIKALRGPAIYIPNAFTPNGDGRNDRFRFIPVGMKEIYYFRIFNRYGQLVFESRNTEPGWDGTLNGKQQPSGTYVWMVSGKDFNDDTNTQRGTVTLVR